MKRPPPKSSPFPHPTLFRSPPPPNSEEKKSLKPSSSKASCPRAPWNLAPERGPPRNSKPLPQRSEDNRPEPQSRLHPVCRLLLEKKKTFLFHSYRSMRATAL